MAVESKIEWTDATFNPWMGCTKVSPACDHCYAEVSTPSRRFGIEWGAGKPRQRTSASNWLLPERWNAEHFWNCSSCGWRGGEKSIIAHSFGAQCPACKDLDGMQPARRRVFCASLADVFDKEVDPEWFGDLWELIRRTPNLDWLILTKRIGRVKNIAGALAEMAWPRNVWLGASIVTQEEADRDIPKLLEIPAAVRFLSMEPLLGPVDLTEWLYPFEACSGCPCPKPWDSREGFEGCCKDPELKDSGIHWVIAGGESGHHARPMNPQWVRDLRDQCKDRTAFLFKQWGEWVSVSEVEGEGRHHTFPDGRTVRHVGKKAAGRTLDGALHTEYPNAR